MKSFFKIAAQFKLLWGIFFTGELIVYMFFAFLKGQTSMPFSLILQLLGIAAIVAAFQLLVDSDAQFYNKLPKAVRLIAHYLIMSILLALLSFAFGWLAGVQNILSFAGIYTVVFIIFTLVFKLYYKVTGEKFNQKLYNYKAKGKNNI